MVAMTDDNDAHAIQVEIARRQGNRAADVLADVLNDAGFAWWKATAAT